MKKCPHCGQSVRSAGSTCPLCRQDMRDSSSRPEPDYSGTAPLPHLSPSRSAALERFWAERSDESLEEAAHNLLDYTDVGQGVIREELKRRSIEVPGPETGVPIYSNRDFLHVDSLQGALKSHGIACEIRTSRSSPLTNRPWSVLWILDASQTEQARQIVQAALDDKARQDEVGVAQALESDREGGIDRGLEANDEPSQGSPSWTCPQCREDVEGQFSVCWNCGSERLPGA